MSLKESRLRLGLTQDDIARVTGATIQTVIRWELGLEAMSLRIARILQEKYGVPLAAFRKNPRVDGAIEADIIPTPASWS